MFYAPARGFGLARDGAPLVPAAIIAFLAQTGYLFFAQWLYRPGSFGVLSVLLFFRLCRSTFGSMLFVALILVPVTMLVVNLFERRGSFSLILQQEYAAFASAVFYAWAAAHLLAVPLAFLASSSGLLQLYVEQVVIRIQQQLPEQFDGAPEELIDSIDLQAYVSGFFWLIVLPPFGLWMLAAVRTVFRLSWVRTVAVMFTGSVVSYIALYLLSGVFRWMFASPFLLLIVFYFLRSYFNDVTGSHRARLAFKQNLEAATLNPADASAHYNLGLIHQQRGELDEARQRFERAVEIDPEEVDAHYQLGRIAREQNRLGDAIAHFSAVVEHHPAHAQYEIWREIGSTYLAAGQYADALNALEKFTEHRQSDPEGLFLQGSAHAGLGHTHEAAASMQSCVEAVKTAPAYKYRTDKRWLNKAQEFLRQ